MNRAPSLLALLALLVSSLSGCVPPPEARPSPPPAAPAPPPQVAAPPAPPPSPYPATPKRPVVNEYHGVRVVDDYQWLEDGSAAEVKAWIAEQNRLTRAHLDAIPQRKVLRDRIAKIIHAISDNRFALRRAGGRLFAMKFQPPKQQPFLVVLASPLDVASERVLVDPATIDPQNRTTIDWYRPSRDGKRVAVSLSKGGTENGTVHVYDVQTGKETGDVVTYAQSGTAGGSLTWARDNKGFYYTRHPHPGERPPADMGFYQQVYFHKLGTKEADDKYAFGKDLPRIAEIELKTSKDGKRVLATVANGDGGDHWHYLMDPRGTWTRFADLPDKIVQADFGGDGKLYLLSFKDAPRGKILRINPVRPDLAKAETLVPESEAVINDFAIGKTRLFVVDLVGGPSQIRTFDLRGKDRGPVPILPISSVFQILPLDGDDLLFRNESYTEPAAFYIYKAKGGSVTKTPMAVTAPVSYADAEVVREMCTSKDGTKVPINILRKKGAPRDGSGAALLNGYGGYGISLQPSMPLLARLLLDAGGIYAVANLRGGGEFGDEWHRAGNLTKKQNVFDDFYACAKFLVERRETSPRRLAIIGGSNGGLLMGAELTQHPEMYKAVVSFVGIYDSIRVELTTNGAFNVTEFGTVKDPAQFKAIRAYSPFHNVKDGTPYPAVLFMTGANDPRVDPYNSRKMTARLQAATQGGIVLLRASEGTGHGRGTPLDERIEELSDAYAFLFKELGMEAKAAP